MKRIIYTVLLVLAAVSCGKEPARLQAIRITANAAGTKGTVTTTSLLETSGAFALDVYIAEGYEETEGGATIMPGGGKYIDSDGGANVTYSGGWIIDGNPSWIADTPMRFWAWHPAVPEKGGTLTPLGPVDSDGKTDFGGEQFKFSYTAPTPDGEDDADLLEDILFAYTKKTYSGKDATVNLTFHHTLAQVRFCISTDDGSFDAKSLGIKKIAFDGIQTAGTVLFSDADTPSFTWTASGNRYTLGQSYNTANFLATNVSGWTASTYTRNNQDYKLLTCSNVFFVIPQTVGKAESQNTISVTFLYQGEEIVKTIDLYDSGADTWLSNHYYTYKINAKTVGRDIDFSVKLVGWSDRDEKLIL